MSVFSTLYTYVTDALGRDDTLGIALAKEGVNFAYTLGALAFQPPELQTSSSLTATSGASSVSLSSLTGLHQINAIFNDTGSITVWLIPHGRWNAIRPTGALTYVKFASRYGNTLHHNSPTSDNSLSLFYLKTPVLLSGDGDTLEYVNHDSFIMAVATQYAFSCLEEKESADLFKTISDTFSIPLAIGSKLRSDVEEVLRSGNYSLSAP